MPVTKEFTIRLEDRPGTLGKLCQALADQNVKILAFQSFPLEKGKSSVHLVLDFPPAARTILDGRRADYTENKVAQVNSSIVQGSWREPRRDSAKRESTSITGTAESSLAPMQRS